VNRALGAFRVVPLVAVPYNAGMSQGPERFATTHWSLVVAARDGSASEAREALAALCGTYWYPLYAFIRRQGHGADEAQDLTQGFFAQLLERDFLDSVDRAKGRFRSFLLAACRHFLANEYDRARAQKRGGGRAMLSLDFQAAEGRYSLEPAHELTPEKVFDRHWALTLLDQVLSRLRDEFTRAEKAGLFERLKGYLTGERSAGPYAQAAAELDMTEGALKVAVHRLRRRYRELLQEEIGRTVSDPAEVKEEIADLFAALGG
jgi:RNA polymerase sigma-70 factor (ECF subfamily)